MGSRRFPGKVLHPIAGKPMLQYVLERLQQCSLLDAIVVATSNDPMDKPIADFCTSTGVSVYRGPLSNVAKRFKEVLNVYQFAAFVRVNGDSPLLDHDFVRKGVELFRCVDADLVTNVFPRTFPAGESVEVVKSASFESAFEAIIDDADLEHVTSFFYRNPALFKIINFRSEHQYSDIHLAVDTERDMAAVSLIVSRMKRPHWEYSLAEIAELHRNATA